MIYNPVNEKVFSLPEMERKIGLSAWGRLYEQKNQMMMIDAFNLITEQISFLPTRYIWRGHLRSQLEEHIQKLGLENRVLLPGRSDKVLEEIKSSKRFFACQAIMRV